MRFGGFPSLQLRLAVRLAILFIAAAAIAAAVLVYQVYDTAGSLNDRELGLRAGDLARATGLAGILTTIWCGLRGLPKDEQRPIFQPVGAAIFAMSGLWVGINGPCSRHTTSFV